MSRRAELEALLGLRFFHPDQDWEAFVRFLDSSERRSNPVVDANDKDEHN